MKIRIFINGDINTPSSRIRWLNYEKDFLRKGVDFKVEKINDYIRKNLSL